MDHIYSVQRRILPSASTNTDWITEGKTVMSVSSKNTIAFTSTTDLSDNTAKISKIHIYVADLNMPWQVHKVMSHTEDITCIEWHISATKLLMADAVGCIQIWEMKDFLLNDWELVTTSVYDEYILAASWFHNGKKIGINVEKKDNPMYLEKYSFVRFSPSLKLFSNKPGEGLIAVTTAGMVYVMIMQPNRPIITAAEILGQFRNKIKVVDICYAKSGDFLIVATDGLVQSSVHCYRVGLKMTDSDDCVITCQPFSSFHLNCHSTCLPGEKQAYTKVTHLKFILRESVDAVVITASGPSGSTVELWELREKPVTFHKLLNTSASESQTKTVVWQHHTSSTSSSVVVSVATPRLSIFDANPPPSFILIAYKDNAIKLFYRENLQLIYSINVNTGTYRRDEHSMYSHSQGMKQTLQGASISDMQLSFTGCTLVAIDSLSQFFLYRLCPITDPGGPMSVTYALTVLEYCLMTGIDWWDVVLSLRPGLTENICEKLTESFTRQPPLNQQAWLYRYLSIKGSLYRCLSSTIPKAGDCHALVMLNSVSSALKGLLRPRDLSSQDKGPAENLSSILTTKAENIIQLDNVLLHLEYKEFAVEPPILSSVNHLTQWVADCALYLLAHLPAQHHSHKRFPGCGLLSDSKALNTLRELLVIIRIWSFLNESCLPVFEKMSDNLDVLSLLFKLLTKTLMQMGSEPDDKLLDECSLLPYQVLIPNLELGTHPLGVATPALFMNSLPLQFECHSQPEFLRYSNKVHTIEGTVPPIYKTDIVRHVGLGRDPSRVRQCTRCYSSSMMKVGTRSAMTRLWDQRWVKNCPCSGQWRLHEKEN